MRLYPEWFVLQAAGRELDRARRRGRPVSLALLAARVDRHPHDVFAALAPSIDQVIRSADVMGVLGPRLAILLPDTDLVTARFTIGRIVRLGSTVGPAVTGGPVELRAGIASYRPDCGYTTDAMVYEAESALLAAEQGPDPVAAFDAV